MGLSAWRGPSDSREWVDGQRRPNTLSCLEGEGTSFKVLYIYLLLFDITELF